MDISPTNTIIISLALLSVLCFIIWALQHFKKKGVNRPSKDFDRLSRKSTSDSLDKPSKNSKSSTHSSNPSTSDMQVKSISKPGKPIQWLEIKDKAIEEVAKKAAITTHKDLKKFNAQVSVIKNIAKNQDSAKSAVIKSDNLKEEEMYSPNTLANILIVDDALVVRKKISDLLKGFGYCTITKNDGWEAYSFLSEIADNSRTPPDIIITDIEMPNMDGLQLIDAIKKNPYFSNIPIIVVSSHVELHMKLVSEGNINGFISKPFKDEDLVSQVEYLLT